MKVWKLFLFQFSVLSFHSPEGVLDSDVAVYSDSQQAEDGALGEYEDEASDEQAAIEVGTEAGADVGLEENITGGKKHKKKNVFCNTVFLKLLSASIPVRDYTLIQDYTEFESYKKDN